jgi:DNA helicase-2/ATP-dependent DNA helicase PcrA
VALTRARRTLCATGHWYSQAGQQRTPSPYLLTLREVPGVEVAQWVAECPAEAPVRQEGDVDWPGPAVYTDLAEPPVPDHPLTLAESARLAALDADIEAVHARELEQSRPLTEVAVPQVLSTTMLMRIARDSGAAALDLARPMPRITAAAARRGTAFHDWVAASSQQLALLPDWDLAADAEFAGDEGLADLVAGYRRTPYAHMVPHAVETEVIVPLAGAVVRGVIDAVYRHADGTWEIVDWKTSRRQTADPMQLAVYRQGWALREGVPAEQVRAAFVYVRDAEVVYPALPALQDYSENSAVTAQ